MGHVIRYIVLVLIATLSIFFPVDAQQAGDSVITLRGHQHALSTAYFSPDGERVVTASYDSSVILWNAHTGAIQFQFTEHTWIVYHASFTPDGMVMSVGADSTIRIWDPSTGRVVKKIPTPFLPIAADISPDGSKIVVIGRFGPSMIFDTSGTPLRPLNGSEASQFTARFSPDGRFIVTAGGHIKPRIWDVETGNELRALSGVVREVLSVRYNPDGTRIIAAADRAAFIYDAVTGELLTSLKDQHLDRVYDASYSPNGRYVVTVSADKSAKIWDVESGTVIRTLLGHSDEIRTTGVFSPDGNRVLTTSLDSTARIWFLETSSVEMPGKAIVHQELRNYPNPVRSRTQVDFKVSQAGHTRLAVYDMLGREMLVLVDEDLHAGDYSIELDARGLASGGYLIVLGNAGRRMVHRIQVE